MRARSAAFAGGFVSLYRIRADFNGIVYPGLLLRTRLVRVKAAIVIVRRAGAS
jgi:hypothetical protein